MSLENPTKDWGKCGGRAPERIRNGVGRLQRQWSCNARIAGAVDPAKWGQVSSMP